MPSDCQAPDAVNQFLLAYCLNSDSVRYFLKQSTISTSRLSVNIGFAAGFILTSPYTGASITIQHSAVRRGAARRGAARRGAARRGAARRGAAGRGGARRGAAGRAPRRELASPRVELINENMPNFLIYEFL